MFVFSPFASVLYMARSIITIYPTLAYLSARSGHRSVRSKEILQHHPANTSPKRHDFGFSGSCSCVCTLNPVGREIENWVGFINSLLCVVAMTRPRTPGDGACRCQATGRDRAKGSLQMPYSAAQCAAWYDSIYTRSLLNAHVCRYYVT